ncbi:LysR family transcriptional regulator [Vibrio maerlii]|uniref:LysR family transcriptional regulator n=1 Tax=Vibrio maerlii TaxID=2231648 RepID=UPI000E3CEB49|nr:LysR family transcriptional regulator [Vibrio maerlii]
MNRDLFFSLDLNLLRTLLVLSQEKNMRKASQRLFVSQPAISQALQKLRNHFDDELFVKAPKGLEATPFAKQLVNDLTPYLDGLANALNKREEFDPETLQQSLRIAVAPVVLTCLSGALFQHLNKIAPNCTIELLGWSKDTFDDLQKGEVLIGLTLDTDAPQGIYAHHVSQIEGKLIVRAGHPITHSPVTSKDMEPYPIASIHSPGWNDHVTIAAEMMKRDGANPTVGFRSQFVMAVVDVIEHTDFFMPHSDLFPLHRFPNLKALTPNINGHVYKQDLYCYYHTKHRNHALITWLHQQIQYVVEQERQQS